MVNAEISHFSPVSMCKVSPSGLYSENQVPESCVDSLVHLAPHFCLTIMIVVFNHSFQLLQSAFNTILFRPIFPITRRGLLETSVGLGIAKAGKSRQEQQAGTGTQAMNVDHEDELRIQAPPGAASASERWLQLDGTGMMPEAQERKQRTTAHTNSSRET